MPKLFAILSSLIQSISNGQSIQTVYQSGGSNIVVNNGVVSINGQVVGGGSTVTGSGKTKTELRTLPTFTILDVRIPIDIQVESSADNQSVMIEADDNLLSLIKTRVEDDRLIFYTDESFSTSKPLRAAIKVKSLVGVYVSGSADVTAKNISGSWFMVDVSGSGDVRLVGKIDRFNAQVSGSGNIRARSLATKEASVSIAGSGDAQVNVSERIDASISGSGNIEYSGSPKKVHQHISGSGNINGD